MQSSEFDATRGSAGQSGGSPDRSVSNWGDWLRHLQAAACVCDAAGYIQAYNSPAVELWGRAPEVGRDQWCGAWRLFRPDGRPLPLDASPMALAIREQRSVVGEEIVIERPDGSRRHVRVFPSPILDAAGHLEGAVNLLVDISEYRDANYARGRLAAIVQSSDDAIISKDLNGIITSWNEGARRIFGYTSEEVVGRPITILMPPERVNEEPGVLARIRRGESVDHYETIRRRKDGSLLDISLTVSPLYDSNGTIIGASKVARDISDRKRVERTFAEEDLRKDEFIATLAHELRNPLAPLKTCLQTMRRAGFSEPVPPSTQEMMERQVNHLQRLVEDLLDLSRLKHGAIELKKARVNLADVIADAVDATTPLLESKGHQLNVALPDPALYVTGDATRLVQVITNLLNNAAKFTHAGGDISVTVKSEAGEVLIICADNGEGIAPDRHEVVFDMFTRGRDSAGRHDGGLGIGLALAKRLVDLHGGSLNLRSEGLGKGSAFTVRLPLAGESAGSGADVGWSEARPGRHILVVDDNQDAVDSLAYLLRALGYTVDTAGSGAAALEVARRTKPDVVLLDIGLPDMTGHEVGILMRQEPWGKAALMVALTGWGESKDRELSAAAGFDHHFVKPIDVDALLALMGNAPS